VKGEGGMVIAPPSVRDDGEYRWLNDHPIADAPQWLLDLVTTKPKSDGKSASKPFEIAEAFKGLDPNQSLGQGIEHRTATIEEICAALAVIPNDDLPWESKNGISWNGMGMAVFAASKGSDEGFTLFDKWSKKSEKEYNAANTAEKWGKYHSCPPTEI